MDDLIKPLDVTLTDIDGQEHVYTISRVPATVGRELMVLYLPVDALFGKDKAEKYRPSHDCMLKMLGYVEAHTPDGGKMRLDTEAKVNNWVPDAETLGRLEGEMIRYNTSFFKGGRASTFFGALAQAGMLRVIKMLTPYLAQFSKKGAPPSMS